MHLVQLDTYIRHKEQLLRLQRNDIAALQLTKLNAVLLKEKTQGRFYTGLPAKLSCLEELQQLPFTTSDQLAEHGAEMLLLSQAEIKRVITDKTSGTTGLVKRVFYTAGDCQNTVEFFAAGLAEMVFPGSRTLITMPFSGPYGLGDLIARAIESLGAEPVRAGNGLSLGQYLNLIKAGQPDSFVGLPGQLLALTRFGGGSSIKRALLSGDTCPEQVESSLQEAGLSLFPHYGSREMGLGGAVTCPAHAGMHVRENHLILEIIDEHGAVVPNGTFGEVVVTTIGMEAMPLIRYRTGDRGRLVPGRCPCGSELVRLDRVSRRGCQMAELDNRLFRLPGLIDYALRVTGNCVEVEALLLDKETRTLLQDKLSKIFKPKHISLHANICQGENHLLYPGKRIVLKGPPEKEWPKVT